MKKIDKVKVFLLSLIPGKIFWKLFKRNKNDSWLI
jgi:hypothetical protein